MTCRLIVRHQAEADIAEAFDGYEGQQEGIGVRFVEAIDRLFQNLQERPLLYPVRYRSVRWAFSVPFPYKVIYHVEDDSVW